MSWDVLVQKFSHRYAAVAEIPMYEKGVPLGPRTAVHSAVSAVFAGVDWSDPGWGRWHSAEGSIEFNVGSDPARSLMLHVRADRAVVGAIVQLCHENGWQAIDCSSGEFLELAPDAGAGLAAWQTYRDHVLQPPQPAAPLPAAPSSRLRHWLAAGRRWLGGGMHSVPRTGLEAPPAGYARRYEAVPATEAFIATLAPQLPAALLPVLIESVYQVEQPLLSMEALLQRVQERQSAVSAAVHRAGLVDAGDDGVLLAQLADLQRALQRISQSRQGS